MPKKPGFLLGQNAEAWPNMQEVVPKSYRCGYCGDKVSSNRGIAYLRTGAGGARHGTGVPAILICPSCQGPSFAYPNTGELFPGEPVGAEVRHVPTAVGSLYDEARGCITGNYHTAAILLCRKILMHIAVEKGAKEGLRFIEYIDHLANSGYVPPNGKPWVDHIRQKGNEANHELVIMAREDATLLLTFVEALLRFIYEFPSSIPQTP
jgi:hypothetical protein